MTHLVLVLVLVAVVRTGACPVMCTCTRSPHVSVHCQGSSPNATELMQAHDLTITNISGSQFEAFVDALATDEILRRLTLAGNQIATLPDCLNFTDLQTLDLSNNSLVSIGRSFRTLQRLEVLNLSANSLTIVDSDSFHELASLKCLDLSGNNLSRLDDSAFASLQALQHLNLSNNHLEILNEKCFISLVKLQQLDLSYNRLVRVELGSLQLPSLARLVLAGNAKLGTSHEPVLLVGTGQRLQSVDASEIGLEQVPAALTHSIRTLRLVGNSIKTVRCGDLDSYPLLQLLDFGSNKLESIEDDALGRLDSLSVLYLTNNNMPEIPKSLSEKLKVLHLEHNRIQQVRTKDLADLTALEVLLLNDNKIEMIEADAFDQLASLVTLDISENPIKILEAGSLTGSMALQVLRLANIAVISPAKEVSFPLSSTERLITLDLSGSPGLTRQLLADTAALAACRQLQELDLSSTGLEYIRSDLLHFLPQLRILRIGGNRINCTQLEWLAAWMRRQAEPEYAKITCSSPPEVWGTPLVDLQDVDREPPTSTSKTTNNETTFGGLEAPLSPLPPSNANEENKTEIFADLVAAPEDGSFGAHDNKSEEFFPAAQSVTLDIDVNSNSSHERGEMSMFSGGEKEEGLHLGLVVLAAGMLGAVAAFVMLAMRYAKRKHAAARLTLEEQDNATPLPGVTELW